MTGEKTYSQRAEALRQRMEYLGFDQAGAAAELGWSVHQVQRFLAGKLKRARDIDVQETQFSRWLAKEENARGLRAPAHGYEDEPAQTPRAAAGLATAPARLSVIGSDGALVQTLSGLADLFGGEGALARLILHEISGFENEPRYRAGETVIAVKGAWPRPGEDCLVQDPPVCACASIAARRTGGSGCARWTASCPRTTPPRRCSCTACSAGRIADFLMHQPVRAVAPR